MDANCCKMQDRDTLTDCLNTQKFSTNGYNLWSGECVDPQLRHEMLNLLREEHEIQNTLFQEMSTRGWYPVQPAQQSQVEQAKTKFTRM